MAELSHLLFMTKYSKSLQFCHDVLSQLPQGKPLVNLLLALTSSLNARSVVHLTKSPFYQYEYSSISKSIAGLAATSEKRAELQTLIQSLVLPYFSQASTSELIDENCCYLIVDTLPFVKEHSPTLAERRYIPISNNVISGNKPISIGYKISNVNLSDPNSKWTLTLSSQRVPIDKTDAAFAVQQVAQVASKVRSELNVKTVVVGLDSFYANPAYLAPIYTDKDLISIVRLRRARRVWTKADKTKHSRRTFGDTYYTKKEMKMKLMQSRNQLFLICLSMKVLLLSSKQARDDG